MDTLEHLRRRLDTCEEVQALVRTMKALAAVSVHQNEHAVRSLSVYNRTVELALQVVLREWQARPRPRPVAADDPLALVVFGSDHGLCGRFNEDVGAAVGRALETPRAAGAPLHLLAVGMRLQMHLAPLGLVPEAMHPMPGTTAQITAGVRRLLFALDEWRSGGVERVWLMYSEPQGGAGCRPVLLELLPLDLGIFREIESRRWAARGLPMSTMAPAALLAALLRQYLFVSLFRACAESMASENSARLVAMQAAEKGLDERGRTLGETLRRQRQEQITAELLEVVSGYEAQRGDTASD